MALLEDQIEEAQAAFVAAHEANDAEGAQVLADHLRGLQAQKAEVDKAVQESSQAGTDLRNPLIAGGAGAVAGAAVNPVRGAIHNIITPQQVAPPPKMTAPAPSGMMPQGNTPYNPRGRSVEESVQNWSNYADAQTEKARGVRRDTSLLKKYPNLQLGPLGAASTPTPTPVPPAPPTMAQKGKNLFTGLVADHQPNSPFSIVKGGARGAVTGAALADVPQQIAQGNYGTAAADTGIGVGNIIHGLARTPKGKAIGSLLGLGSGATRAYQGIGELMPEEQKADGGLVHLAGGGMANALTQTAINAPYVAPTAVGIAKNVAKGAYAPAMEDAASLGLAMAPLNPLTAGLSLMAPGEAGAGSTADEWRARKAAEEAARQRAQKQFEHEEFMRTKVGANAPQMLKDYEVAKIRKGLAPKMAGGGAAKEALELAKKAFAPKQTQVLRASEALGPHEGKWLNITQSDRMRSTGGDLGGPGFSRFQGERPEYAEAQAAWGVGNQPTASRIVNVNKKFPEGQSIWTPMIGSETQHHSNQHVYDALTEEFNRQVAAGKLTPELRQRINQKLAMAANKEGKPIFQEGSDIANPEHLQQMGSTFERRGNVANLLAGNTVGGQKGRIIDYPGIMQEMADPMTVGAPTHALGTRLFTLNNQIENRPDLHSAFPYILKGEDQGVAFAPVPKELGIQDWINQFREFKGREPGFMDLTRNAPSQQITDTYLRSLEAAGHAAGGKIGAAGKLLGEAQAAYKSKFTPNFVHFSPSPNIKAFDPSRSKKDLDFTTPGVTFVAPMSNAKWANDNFLPVAGDVGQKEMYKTGATGYPVSVNLGKHFDASTPEGQKVIDEFTAKFQNTKMTPDARTNLDSVAPGYAEHVLQESIAQHKKDLGTGNYSHLELPEFLQHLRDTGHNTFSVNESTNFGRGNVGVFEPQNIRGKFAKFNPEDAASPDFMKAEGGPVQHFQVGGLAKMASKFARHPHGQDPRVAQALEEYLKGNISQEERIRVMNQFLPMRQWNELPPNYTDEQIKNALMANKQGKALAPVPAGAQVGNRLDIPAYTQHGVYVDTTHDLTAGNAPISYGRTGHLTGVDFSSKPNQAVRVGLGTKEQALTPMGAEMGSAKSPFALIKGTNVGTSDDEVRRMMTEMMQDPNYTQIGMDPRKHSQFYDKSTGMPVWSAEEKLQSGPLILAPKKGLETTSWDDPRLNLTDFPGKKYKKGGKV